MSSRGRRGNFNKFNRNSGPRDRPVRAFRTVDNEPNNQDRCKKFITQERLSEPEAGITEYISTVPGFSGIIKARYSDFHVNEINLAGEVAKLTDTAAPNDFSYNPVMQEEQPERPLDLISQETWAKLDEVVGSAASEPVVMDVAAFTKEQRTQIHEIVKKVYGKDIVTKTMTEGEAKSIEFKKYVAGDKGDRRWAWPKDKGEYVYFLVYKEVVDTIEACFKISDALKMKSGLISYAGVKDRRAKTTQWFCVRKMDPRKLVNKSRGLRNIHIGNFTFHDQPLKLGQLSGNRFRIALRNVSADDSVINPALEALKDGGFINYYGLQRFGNDKEVPTYDIGVKLLQGNWKDACELILKVKDSEDPHSDIAKAKRVFKETGNAELASKEFSRGYNKCIESKLLLGFVKNHERDYVNALENLPRNMRLLYIHAFQSLVWNRVASRRISEFGLKPVVGDIVLLSEKTVEEDLDDEHDSDESIKEDTRRIIQEIKILGEDDLSKYTIYDIVLPLPGYDVQYPNNALKDYYKEILDEHKLTLEMPKQKVKTYTLSGDYRKLLGQVRDLSWKTTMYNHPNDTLIQSDYEELKGYALPADDPQGRYKALVVDFCLSSSSYATMVLREFLKMDTSTVAHAKLNTYHSGAPKAEQAEKPNSGPGKEFAEADSLLKDAAKYEAFKQQIFGGASEDFKRKLDEEEGEANGGKKIKIAVEDTESGIKIQPSLV